MIILNFNDCVEIIESLFILLYCRNINIFTSPGTYALDDRVGNDYTVVLCTHYLHECPGIKTQRIKYIDNIVVIFYFCKRIKYEHKVIPLLYY